MKPVVHTSYRSLRRSLLALVALALPSLLVLAQQRPNTPKRMTADEQHMDSTQKQLTNDYFQLLERYGELVGNYAELINENIRLAGENQQLLGAVDSLQLALSRGRYPATPTKPLPAADTNTERQRLEREITAVLQLGTDVNDALPLSLQQRAESTEPHPANLPDLRLYRYQLGRLQQGRALLTRPPNASAAKEAAELEVFIVDADRFPGLEADRRKLITALAGYCERAVQLAKVIQSASEGRMEAERVDYLDRYQANQYPYLQQQLQRARADARFRMPAPNCQ